MFQTMTQDATSPAHPLPPWLASLTEPTLDTTPSTPSLSLAEIARIKLQDQLDTFEALFEPAIDALSGGTSITLFLSFDHRAPHPGRFMRWIKADPTRYRRYLEAREIAAELISGDIVGIADGKDNPMEDVARSKLRVDARRATMSYDAKERFTTTTKIDVSGHQTISVTAAMAPALERAKEMAQLARERMARLPSPLVTDVTPRMTDEPLVDDLTDNEDD